MKLKTLISLEIRRFFNLKSVYIGVSILLIINGETRMKIIPPENLEPDDYGITIKSFCYDGNNKVESNDIVFRIENKVEKSSSFQYILIALLIAFLVSIMFLLVKFSKK